MVLNLQAAGIDVEVQHHEVGGPGQAEIDIRYGTLLQTADKVLKYKYIVKQTAAKAGHVVTFMPKPLFGDNGSGMHTHQSLWKDGTNIFYDEAGYALLSETARHYIGGLLKHAHAVLAFAAPTTNSYRRLVPGYEAPINLVYSQRNRSACIRIPTYFTTPEARRLEFRSPDPTCNPYLSFSAQLLAGMDGIINGIEPPAPLDKDIYELPPEEKLGIAGTPGKPRGGARRAGGRPAIPLSGGRLHAGRGGGARGVSPRGRQGGRAAPASVRVLPLQRALISHLMTERSVTESLLPVATP